MSYLFQYEGMFCTWIWALCLEISLIIATIILVIHGSLFASIKGELFDVKTKLWYYVASSQCCTKYMWCLLAQHVTEPMCRCFGISCSIVIVVHEIDTESDCVSQWPLEVVKKRPSEITLHIWLLAAWIHIEMYPLIGPHQTRPNMSRNGNLAITMLHNII